MSFQLKCLFATPALLNSVQAGITPCLNVSSRQGISTDLPDCSQVEICYTNQPTAWQVYKAESINVVRSFCGQCSSPKIILASEIVSGSPVYIPFADAIVTDSKVFF